LPQTPLNKTQIIGDYRQHDTDTGSPEVQVALLTQPHQRAHRALQDPHQGPSRPPRAAQARRPAPPPARLPEAHQRRALPPLIERLGSASRSLPSNRLAADLAAGLQHRSSDRPLGRSPPRASRKEKKRNESSEIRRDVGNGTIVSNPATSPSRPTARPCAPRRHRRPRHRLHAPEHDAARLSCPLTVDYREYTYAAGRIPGGFFKREGRPTEKEIITSRLIDRPLRPLFPSGLLQRDADHRSGALRRRRERPRHPGAQRRLDGAGPLRHPLLQPDRRGARRPGRRRAVFNPTNSQRDAPTSTSSSSARRTPSSWSRRPPTSSPKRSCSSASGPATPRSEGDPAQIELFRELGLSKPTWEPAAQYPAELFAWSRARSTAPSRPPSTRARRAARNQGGSAQELPRGDPRRGVREAPAGQAHLRGARGGAPARRPVLDEGKRFDGRALDEVRPIDHRGRRAARTHGSALFTRGETQALVTVTLGTKRRRPDHRGVRGRDEQKFLLHYNFPPFSVGEVKFLRGTPGRREIGHGVLARAP
jgi:hypothetical protein